MDPALAAITSQMTAEEQDALATDLTALADAHGVQLTPEVIEGAILGAYNSGDFSGAGLASQFDGASYEPPSGEQEFFTEYADRRGDEDAEQLRQERLFAQAERDAEAFASRLGRVLTGPELSRLGEQQRAQVERGGHLDVDEAAQAAGIKPFEAMSSHEQAAAMADRMRELGGSGGDESFEVPVTYEAGPEGSGYQPDWDNMSRKDSARLMAAQLSGVELSIEREED